MRPYSFVQENGEFVSPTASFAASWRTIYSIELGFHVFAQRIIVVRHNALDHTRIAMLFDLTVRGAA